MVVPQPRRQEWLSLTSIYALSCRRGQWSKSVHVSGTCA